MCHLYKKTKIYRCLAAKNDDLSRGVRAFLDRDDVMPTIEKILAKSNTSGNNFTLHDESHSFRVADRMFDLIPKQTRKILSSYEYAMLLLSAYLHDIGMSPEQKTIEQYERYLLLPDKKSHEFGRDELSSEDIKELEGFILNTWEDAPFLNDGNTTFDNKNKCLLYEILTYFARYKHNDWSEKWINDNLSRGSSLYNGWIVNLINICKSHHYDIEELKNGNFDPCIVNDKDVVHLRYIAICLRIADVMEVDPERTPEVILKHRNIPDENLIYWLKDHGIILTIDKKYHRVSIYARPKNALLHRAIEETISQIEDELRKCSDLVIDKPLSACIVRNNDLKHQWVVQPSIIKDISPLNNNNNYIYVDSQFKINHKKILNLLAGSQLYKDPLFAIRELLQNAFDAVKECIAYKRLNEEDCTEDAIRANYNVNISLVKEKEKEKKEKKEKKESIYLICEDNGIGMTKSIITECFLVGGSLTQKRLYSLEHDCNIKGFSIERTGTFGIGVLSYFMIADALDIYTKRSELPNDNETIGWHLNIPGLFEFGELKQREKNQSGTRIKLKLKDNIIDNIELEKDIIEAIDSFLLKIPCKLTFKSEISGQEKTWGVGWTYKSDYYTSMIINGIEKRKENRWDRDISNAEFDKIIADHSELLKWHIIKGNLPHGWGEFKIFLPYYVSDKGNYLAYMITDKSIVRNGKYFIPTFENLLSWRGMRIENYSVTHDIDDVPYFFLLNLVSPKVGEIEVSRKGIEIDDDVVKEILGEIKRRYIVFCDDMKKKKKKNQDKMVSSVLYNNVDIFQFLAKDVRKKDDYNCCYKADENNIVKLMPYDFGYDIKSKKIDNLLISSLDNILINKNSDSVEELLVGVTCGKFKFLSSSDKVNKKIYRLKFPPKLNNICCIYYKDKMLLNNDNWLIKNIDFSQNIGIVESYISSIRIFSPKISRFYDLTKDDKKIRDVFLQQINDEYNQIQALLDSKLYYNILFDYCSFVCRENILYHLLNDSSFLPQLEFDSDIPIKLDVISKPKLKEYISYIPNGINGLKFITIDYKEGEDIFKLYTFSDEGVEVLNNKDEILSLFNSVDDEWRFDYTEK